MTALYIILIGGCMVFAAIIGHWLRKASERAENAIKSIYEDEYE